MSPHSQDSATATPLVDLCLPTCNSNPAYLVQAIESVLKQTETRWRMYIHDDGSTVDVEKIVQPYLTDERVSWHPNRTKLGIGGNWNATMKLGSAPYVQFLFQDDWFEPWALEEGLKAMEAHESVGIVSLNHMYVGEQSALQDYNKILVYNKEHVQPGFHSGKDTLWQWIENGLHPNIVGEPVFTMYRRSVMEKIGPFLEDMNQNLDVEYAVRCLQASDWYKVEKNCGYFRVHEEATSAVNQREGKGIYDRFRCMEIFIDSLQHSSDKKRAIKARNNALTGMAKNYLKRLQEKKTVMPAGGSSFKAFALRHPVLVGRALVRAITQTS